MKGIGFILLFLLVNAARAEELPDKGSLNGSVDLSSNYVYNIFYDANRAISDESLDVTPKLAGRTRAGWLGFKGEASGVFEQFAKYSIQTHTDAAGSGALLINEPGTVSASLAGEYKSFSDPSPNETFGRINRTVAGAKAAVKIKTNDVTTLDFGFKYALEQFVIPSISVPYFNNTNIEGSALYTNRFLPETSWIVRARAGTRTFPNKTLSATDIADSSVTLSAPKNDDVYGLLETGFVGRLTEKSSIDMAVGWALRTYSTDYQNTATSQINRAGTYDFNAPVFYMRFIEQISRRDQFVVGYNYTVDDAYVTNNVLNQEIYAGIMRVLGDQVLFLTRLSYEYLSYSLPAERFDERVCASFMVKYSLSPTIKVTADLKMDLLSSDAYYTGTNTAAVDFTPDRPANYQAGTFGLGLVAAF